MLDGTSALSDLGRRFGPLFHEREAQWPMAREWARTAEDILTRRTRHGLFMSQAERAAIADWLDPRSADLAASGCRAMMFALCSRHAATARTIRRLSRTGRIGGRGAFRRRRQP
jgi:glycerol-3-phosphate dehydrogenase